MTDQTQTDRLAGLKPAALLQKFPNYPDEAEPYRNGAGCLTDADKRAGWTETRLYSEEVVQSLSADLANAEARVKELSSIIPGVNTLLELIAATELDQDGAIVTQADVIRKALNPGKESV